MLYIDSSGFVKKNRSAKNICVSIKLYIQVSQIVVYSV